MSSYGDISIPPVDLRTLEAQLDLGREARKQIPRSAVRECVVPDRNPIALLQAQDTTRLPDLVPLRYGRMQVDPFRFYRGTAVLMAYDLERQPRTGVEVLACGDAHLSNFGFYASPERNLIFDLNDFDESAPAPWEWDLKRLAASAVIGARQRGVSRRESEKLAVSTVATYRTAIQRLAGTSLLNRYYWSVRDDMLAQQMSHDPQARKEIEKVAGKARRRTSEHAARRLLETGENGRLRFREDPPVLTHLGDTDEQQLTALVNSYLASTRPDITVLLSSCRLVDVARRVVGVGSVGTRCYVAALVDPSGAPIILQIKQAQSSVLLSHHARHALPRMALFGEEVSEGRRVVICQQILQAFSDAFLGWLSFDGLDFYVRQFRDMKGSFDADTMDRALLARYVQACAVLLARAHSQSPACAWIAGYLGSSEKFDRAVGAWSSDYADQAEKDFDALRDAIASGAVPVAEG